MFIWRDESWIPILNPLRLTVERLRYRRNLDNAPILSTFFYVSASKYIYAPTIRRGFIRNSVGLKARVAKAPPPSAVCVRLLRYQCSNPAICRSFRRDRIRYYQELFRHRRTTRTFSETMQWSQVLILTRGPIILPSREASKTPPPCSPFPSLEQVSLRVVSSVLLRGLPRSLFVRLRLTKGDHRRLTRLRWHLDKLLRR